MESGNLHFLSNLIKRFDILQAFPSNQISPGKMRLTGGKESPPAN
jgi:hypothetical protein